MPIVLELMGLPAAGKSTFACAMRERARQAGLPLLGEEAAFRAASRGPLHAILNRLPSALREALAGPMTRLDAVHLFMTRDPAFFSELFRIVERALPAISERQSFLYAVLRQCALREVIETSSPAPASVLVEEGFAHRAMTLLGYGSREKIPDADLASYLERMPKPNALVWVDTPPEVCAQRLFEREHPPIALQAIPRSEWEGRLRGAEKILQRVAAGLRSRGVDVWRIQNTGRNPSSDPLSPVLQWLSAHPGANT